jgi:hypothetical protein
MFSAESWRNPDELNPLEARYKWFGFDVHHGEGGPIRLSSSSCRSQRTVAEPRRGVTFPGP